MHGCRKAVILLVLLSSVVQPLTPAAAQAGSLAEGALEPWLDEKMTALLADYHIPGGVIAVVQDGALVHAQGYGWADLEAQTPMQADTTLVRIASITKLFTRTAVMQLVEQGRLDLNADIAAYLDFEIRRVYPGPITLRHLLSHTAGFEDRNILTGALTPYAGTLRDALVAYIPLQIYAPGEVIAYSNYGAALAGYIVARVSGLSWEAYVEAHLLTPPDVVFQPDAGRFAGECRAARAAFHTIERLLWLQNTVYIPAIAEDTLLFENRGWTQITPLCFRRSGSPRHLCFREDADGKPWLVSTGTTDYARLAWYQTPGFNLLFLVVCALALLSAAIAWPLAARRQARDRVPAGAGRDDRHGVRGRADAIDPGRAALAGIGNVCLSRAGQLYALAGSPVDFRGRGRRRRCLCGHRPGTSPGRRAGSATIPSWRSPASPSPVGCCTGTCGRPVNAENLFLTPCSCRAQ
ncbi:MAG: beta-lactamase family protein [Anaerolineae bacterium]|nr:beta-lactamase family protein [Anaerolineae bacterium]